MTISCEEAKSFLFMPMRRSSCVTGALNKAPKDLDDAFTISIRGRMRLHLADCHLEYTQLVLAKVPNLRKDEEEKQLQ